MIGGELPALGLDEILARHAVLIDRIRVGYAGPQGCFESQVAPLIRRFAAFVHLLPATREGHFREPGGCLHCGLEVGLHAVQAVDGQIFSARGTVPERRAAAPRWRAAALATGLCMEIHRPLFGAVVRDGQGVQWNPLLTPLFEWLREGGREQYSIEWLRADASRSATLAVLPHLLGPSLIEFLSEGDRSILVNVLAAIGAAPGTEANALGATVEQTLSRVAARHLRHLPAPHPLPPCVALAEPATDEPRDRASRVPFDVDQTGEFPSMDPAHDVAPSAPAPATAETHASPDLAPPQSAGPPASNQAPRTRIAIPTTLNPLVAEALGSLLYSPETGTLAAGIETSEEGVFVPLAVWEGRGLDTGLVVRALQDAQLLVLQGVRKVWCRREGDEEVPGLMLTRRLLA